MSRIPRSLVLVALTAFLLKTAIALTTYGSTDVLIFETDVAKMRRDGGVALYRDGISSEWCGQIDPILMFFVLLAIDLVSP